MFLHKDIIPALPANGLIPSTCIRSSKNISALPISVKKILLDDFFKSIEKAWDKIGITSKISETEPNEYYIEEIDGSKT